MTQTTQCPAPEVDLTTCDREPIHIPGRIQPHGVLLALQEPELTIVQISQNSGEHLDIPPEQLLNQSVRLLLNEEGYAVLQQHLQNTNTSYDNPLQLTVQGKEQRYVFDGIIHRHDQLLMVELENRRAETTNQKAGIAAIDTHFHLVRRAMTRLHTATTLSEACDVLVQEVRHFTGFDRVMVYKFHTDGHGEVIAEAIAPEQETFLGLHYPASDIPQQARRLYALNWLRLIADVHYQPVDILPANNPLTNAPLDLSFSVLRSVSPIHLQYLQNMGVQSSMSISLLQDTQLWGLIACHHRTPKFVPYEVRAACELLGIVMSLQLSMKELHEETVDRSSLLIIHNRLLKAVMEDGLVEGLSADVQDLLALTAAEGAAIVFGEAAKCVGHTPSQDQITGLIAWLQQQPSSDPPSSNIFCTNALPASYPPAVAYKDSASGLLAIALSRTQGDYILFFRPEVIQTVNWGGDPRKPVERSDGDAPILTPRKSFELWKETVHHQSLPWRPVHLEMARELRNALGVFIIERVQELERINQELQQRNSDLDSFAYVASHDLKEPLRGIYSYAYYLSENYGEQLDSEAQNRLQGLMRLTKRMDILLDSLLHFSRIGRAELAQEPVDLNAVLNEALEMLSARRTETQAAIRVPRPLPVVACDYLRVREVFSNLISNALKYNHKPEAWVEIGYREPTATAPYCFYVRDNGIGIRSRYYDQIFQMFKRLHGREEYGGGAGAGLTITKKIIERHNGKIWVESTYGEGSTFYFTLAPDKV
ncbi:MAG: GAF domain-containing protein [Caldilineaceae bacterium]